MKYLNLSIAITGLVIALFSLQMSISKVSTYIPKQQCFNAQTEELHWLWRLNTDEVQNDLEVLEITDRMYRESVKDRIRICIQYYKEN